ncbi:MAG TPA: class I SAM-dependent methyltransferase [Geminicoccaceae bacterium]
MTAAPSAWVARFAPLVPAGAAVLDLAAGGGRHSALFLGRGHPVTAVDRNVAALAGLREREGARLEVIEADLEDGTPWPLSGRRFGGIVVVNYLWRPLFDRVLDAVDEGGVLIYATFMTGHERHGPPTRPDFLLRPQELLEVVRGRLQVIAFEQGLAGGGRPAAGRLAVRQRICAGRSSAPWACPPWRPDPA